MLVRWYRYLIAAKYDGSKNRSPGRPPTATDVRELMVRVASATSSSHLCRQARLTLAPSCRESDLEAFSSTTAVPPKLWPGR